MKIRVMVKQEGFDVKTYVDKAKVRMRDFMAPLTKGGNVMLRSIDMNFKTAGRPKPWKRLAKSTILFKFKHGYSPLPLTRTGALRRSVVFRASKDSLKIGTAIPYAPHHQFGTSRMPARPFLVFQKEDVQKIERLILEHATGKRAI